VRSQSLRARMPGCNRFRPFADNFGARTPPLQILTSTTATAGRINYLDGTWGPHLPHSHNKPSGQRKSVAHGRAAQHSDAPKALALLGASRKRPCRRTAACPGGAQNSSGPSHREGPAPSACGSYRWRRSNTSFASLTRAARYVEPPWSGWSFFMSPRWARPICSALAPGSRPRI